jgi:hypothetical protein
MRVGWYRGDQGHCHTIKRPKSLKVSRKKRARGARSRGSNRRRRRPAGGLGLLAIPGLGPVVAAGWLASTAWKVAPWRPRSQDPEDALEDTTVIHPRHAARRVRQHRLDGSPFVVIECVAHDSAPSVRGLNHGLVAGLNTPLPSPFGRYAPESGPIMLTLSFVDSDPDRT